MGTQCKSPCHLCRVARFKCESPTQGEVPISWMEHSLSPNSVFCIKRSITELYPASFGLKSRLQPSILLLSPDELVPHREIALLHVAMLPTPASTAAHRTVLLLQ